MKIFIVFALISVASVVYGTAEIEKQDKLIDENIKKCKETFPISDAEIDLVKNGKVTDGNEALRCFVKCFLEASGIMKNGELLKDAAIEKFSVRIPAKDAQNAYEVCKVESGSAKCETEMKMMICLQKQGVH